MKNLWINQKFNWIKQEVVPMDTVNDFFEAFSKIA